mmetsp:Transcript_81744/g.230103  ORF Transcript_81744/g.230103 Transcript_81744/m.230103 type:complete len:226 (+) Transcript_81744:783-1460(+)
MEPECRWALLARGRLTTALAACEGPAALEAAEVAVAKGYEEIASLDPLRKGFYAEARANSLARLRILGWLRQVEGGRGLGTSLDLSGLSLRHLAPSAVHSLFGLRRLDVSGAGLTTFGPLLQLRSLEELLAARNSIAGDVRELFCLPRLKRADVSGNALGFRATREGDEVAPPASLAELDASGNASVLAELRRGGPEAVLARLLPSGGWAFEGGLETGRCLLCRR